MTLLMAMEETNIFEAIFLHELTVSELMEKMSKAFGIPVNHIYLKLKFFLQIKKQVFPLVLTLDFLPQEFIPTLTYEGNC